MNYVNSPNLLLETLSCMSRIANGNTWADMEERIQRRGFRPTEAFGQTLGHLTALTARLTGLQALEQPEIAVWFQNMEGFPRNTIGSASPAFLVFYGLLERFDGNWEALDRYVSGLGQEQVAYHLALALDLADDYPDGTIPEPVFLDMVLSQALPDGSKITILNVFRNFAGLYRQMVEPVRTVLEQLARERLALEELCQVLNRKILTEGCEAYLARTSRLEPEEDTQYELRPFLFGADTSLTSQQPDGTTRVYCGILREELLDMLSGKLSMRDSVYEAVRLLGDRTRFDLICYLRDHKAYGQELSAQFGLSRNTIHHHMSKLCATGLVRCNTHGNRVYYSLDERMIRLLLEHQKELFCGGNP